MVGEVGVIACFLYRGKLRDIPTLFGMGEDSFRFLFSLGFIILRSVRLQGCRPPCLLQGVVVVEIVAVAASALPLLLPMMTMTTMMMPAEMIPVRCPLPLPLLLR